MSRLLLSRTSILVLGIVFVVLAIGFITHQGWATALWPSADGWGADPLADLFVGSMLAAVGGGALYVAWLDDLRAAAGGALALLVLYAGMAIAVAVVPGDAARFTGYIVAFALFAVVAAFLLAASLATPPVDRRPVPRLVRVAFVIFTLVLIVTGTMLVMAVPRVFPWPLPTLSSVLYGCMFLGFAANYAYAMWKGTMADAKVSLFGFFVYDAVLIVPFLRHFGVVADDFRFSLAFYTANLIFSALVAVYCFAIDRRRLPYEDADRRVPN